MWGGKGATALHSGFWGRLITTDLLWRNTLGAWPCKKALLSGPTPFSKGRLGLAPYRTSPLMGLKSSSAQWILSWCFFPAGAFLFLGMLGEHHITKKDKEYDESPKWQQLTEAPYLCMQISVERLCKSRKCRKEICELAPSVVLWLQIE